MVIESVRIEEEKNIKIITILLCIYLLLAPLDFMAIIPGVSLSRVLIFLPLIGFTLNIKNTQIILDRYLVLPVLYMMFLAGSIFYSYNMGDTFGRTLSISFNIGVILVLSWINYNSYEIDLFKKSLVYSGWLTVLLMMLYGDTSLNRLTVIVNGNYQDPNYLSGFLIFSIIYYLDELIKGKKTSALIKVVIFLYFVLLTGSRGGMIAILVSMVFYIFTWMHEQEFKIKSFLKIITIVIFVIIMFSEVMQLLPESVSQRFSLEYSINDSGAGRFDIWKVLINNLTQFNIFRIFFGTGAGTVVYSANGFVAHNLWIESLVEVGVIGTSLLIGFYFVYLKSAYKMKEYVIYASFIGYLVMSLSMSLFTYKPIFNILLMINIIKNHNKEHMNNSIKLQSNKY